ncbi:adenylate/guanylate cyclase domain-containing protein [Pantoea sp. AG702]|uniref:nucleotide-binding domain-containing protein n=1 Tax=Pantoea sp. AG702 TaxID=2183907 RepID=UPI000D710A6C|nr:adenylate/guanylate cyclase domain-containing protein [Pantoea sp. AG702]PWW17734.1 adenylate/guanylate cyclase family protein [Pantoea sp. AG702]
MSIKDLYKNLNSDIEKISKRSKSESYDFFSKRAFDSAGMESLEPVSEDAKDVELERFSKSLFESVNSQSVIIRDGLTPLSDYEAVRGLREAFGKPEREEVPTIGTHPEFRGLELDNTTKFGYVVTMFIDIIGSTKLGLSYSPSDVFLFKNNIITGVIETINAFDGHVHRIMGDAVMAFFRSKENEDRNTLENSAIDAINCAAYFIEVMNEIVAPQIKEVADENIGIRIGIDIGESDYVLWGNYGIPGINEVTATSFFVDIASKLQHKAPKNSIMLGESLVKKLGLTINDYLEYKIKNSEPDRYVIDYTSKNKERLRYGQYLLNQTKYFSLLPHGVKPCRIKVDITYSNDEYGFSNKQNYISCGSVIPKNKWIKFHAFFHEGYGENYESLKFKFRVVNNGAEASKKHNNDNHETEIIKQAHEKENGIFHAYHREETSYKGLQHMYISVISNGKIIESEFPCSIFIQ